jgi:aspartate 1-decarboxylase
MKTTFAAIFFFLAISNTYSQANDTEALLYNISIGSVFGTIGSLINKKPTDNVNKAICRGLTEGALGGYLTFESKRLLRVAVNEQDWQYRWYSKLLNAAGASIIENTASNRKFGEQWNLNFGFLRLEFLTVDKLKIQPKIMPIAFVYTIGAAFQTKFEVTQSLRSGQLIFSSNSSAFVRTNSIGIAYPGLMVLQKDYINEHDLISHETIHIYQQNDCNVFNTYLNKPVAGFTKNNKALEKLNKFIYYDFDAVILYTLNKIENSNRERYYDNFLEQEAGYFSNTLRRNEF